MATISFLNGQQKRAASREQAAADQWVARLEAEVFSLLPANLRLLVSQVPWELLAKLEEIRLRKGREISFKYVDGDFTIDQQGKITTLGGSGYRITDADLNNCLQLISNCSVYALEEEFKRAFITVKGGHRVGIVGKAVLSRGQLKTQRDFSSLNIRLAREVKGVAGQIMPLLLDPATGSVHHVLIISPPGCGKTTLLRDLIRLTSSGVPQLGLAGVNVGLVDERSEIAACYKGVPQNDVGLRTDVLDACPKAEGMVLMLRSMNPQVLATDEIGSEADVQAVREVINCGVKLFTTVHGDNLGQLLKRPALKALIEEIYAGRFIVLSKKRGVGTIEGIYDSVGGQNLLAPAAGHGGGKASGKNY